jgi:hypothetical protein
VPVRRLTVVHCLVGLAAALLAGGVASGSTTWRSIVLIIPVVVATAMALIKPSWGASAALPLFVFWLANAAVISLGSLGFVEIPIFLPGDRTFPGDRSPVGVRKAGLCLAGIVKAMPLIRGVSWPLRALWFVGFAVLHFAFILISLMSVGPVPII